MLIPYGLVDLCSDNTGTCLQPQGILHKHTCTSLRRSYHIRYWLQVLKVYVIVMKACLEVLTAPTHSPQSSMSEAEQTTAITAAAKQIAARARPVMLLLDGHSSHYELDTICIAQNQGMWCFVSLHTPRTCLSHLMCFFFSRPLKPYWSDSCHKYMQDNPGHVVTKYQFSALFSQA